jgi:DNA-binding CsgD family transcriptional regulator
MAPVPADALRTALTLLAGCNTTGREPFTPDVLGGLAGLIGSDFVTFQETRGTTCVSFVQCPDDPRRGRSPPFETECNLSQRLEAGEVAIGEVADQRDRELGLRYFAALALDVSGSTRPLLVARSHRRLGARERALLEFLGPPLSAHSRNARTQRQFARALVALGDSARAAAVLLDIDGEVAFATPLARRLMRKHFDRPDLPAALTSELRAGGLAARTSPEGDGAILTIEALGPERTTLILREERAAATLLTARQRGIMQLVGEGRRDAEIGRELWITTATVRKHLQHIYARLGVHSRTEALALLQPMRPPPP